MNRHFLLSLLLTVFLGTPLSAQGNATVFQMIEELRDDVEKIVHRYDPDALVFFYIVPDVEAAKLLGTPYALNQIVINDSLGMPKVQEFTVSIVSSEKEMQKTIAPLLEAFFKPYGGKLNLTVQLEGSQDRSVASVSETKKSGFEPWMWVVFGAILLGGAIFFFLRKKKDGPENLKQTIIDSAEKIASALEMSRSEPTIDTGIEEEMHTTEANELEDKLVADFSFDSASAILSDCYWGSYDKYASFIWRRLTQEVKQKVIASSGPLPKYVRYAATLAETNYGFHMSPYYLNPFDINSISNTDLTDFVRTELEVLNFLPDMRGNALTLKAAERVKASTLSDDLDRSAVSKKLQTLKASKERALPMVVKLTINSVDDELELMELSELTFEMKKSVPSVVWADELSEEDLEAILQDFSAIELAEMWVGPEVVLDKLKQAMPEKKYGLINSYVEKVSPSRKSNSMLKFHSAVMEFLSGSHEEEDIEDVA